jgi:hypothetical protein
MRRYIVTTPNAICTWALNQRDDARPEVSSSGYQNSGAGQRGATLRGWVKILPAICLASRGSPEFTLCKSLADRYDVWMRTCIGCRLGCGDESNRKQSTKGTGPKLGIGCMEPTPKFCRSEADPEEPRTCDQTLLARRDLP